MPTSVHLPPDLLAWIDREAARRAVPRNGLIVNILSREMNAHEDWPYDLFPSLVESAMSEKDGDGK